MILSRREFGGYLAKQAASAYLLRTLLLADLAGTGLVLESCGPLTLASVMSAIATWLPVGIQAVDSFVVIASPANSKIATDGAAIQKLFLDIQPVVTSIQSAPTVLAKIQALTSAIPQWEQDIATLGLTISATDKEYIAAGVAIVMIALSAYQAELQAQLSASPATKVVMLQPITGEGYGFELTANGYAAYIDMTGDNRDALYWSMPQSTASQPSKSAYIVPKPPKLGAWKRQFNAVAKKYGHSDKQIKLSMAEHLRIK